MHSLALALDEAVDTSQFDVHQSRIEQFIRLLNAPEAEFVQWLVMYLLQPSNHQTVPDRLEDLVQRGDEEARHRLGVLAKLIFDNGVSGTDFFMVCVVPRDRQYLWRRKISCYQSLRLEYLFDIVNYDSTVLSSTIDVTSISYVMAHGEADHHRHVSIHSPCLSLC